MGSTQVQQSLENALSLVVLLEELLREATLLGSQVEQFTVVILGIEIQRQHTGNIMAATT